MGEGIREFRSAASGEDEEEKEETPTPDTAKFLAGHVGFLLDFVGFSHLPEVKAVSP